MVSDKQRRGLERDFERKRESYYRSNYVVETPRNSLRRERRARIVEWIARLERFECVLDVGCGPAVLYEGALQRCRRYVAMDLVRSNLEKIGVGWGVETVQADLDSLSWTDEPPDLILCAGCLEYTRSPLDNVAKLAELLPPGGHLVLSLANLLSPYRLWFEYGYRPLVRAVDFAGRQPRYSRTLLRAPVVSEVLASHGLEVDQQLPLGSCFLPAPLDSWFPRLADSSRRLLERRAPFLEPFSVEFLVFAHRPDKGAGG